MTSVIDYAAPGRLTDLHRVALSALAHIPTKPLDICRLAQHLVIQPGEARSAGLPEPRFAENQIRPVDRLIEALLSLDPAPVDVPREPGRRVIGTCRHFGVLSCALLRYRGVAARARCGFATYFQPQLAV